MTSEQWLRIKDEFELTRDAPAELRGRVLAASAILKSAVSWKICCALTMVLHSFWNAPPFWTTRCLPTTWRPGKG